MVYFISVYSSPWSFFQIFYFPRFYFTKDGSWKVLGWNCHLWSNYRSSIQLLLLATHWSTKLHEANTSCACSSFTRIYQHLHSLLPPKPQQALVSFNFFLMNYSNPIQGRSAFHLDCIAKKHNIWQSAICKTWASQPFFHWSLKKRKWTTFFRAA
jgi:hypothetical protein